MRSVMQKIMLQQNRMIIFYLLFFVVGATSPVFASSKSYEDRSTTKPSVATTEDDSDQDSNVSQNSMSENEIQQLNQSASAIFKDKIYPYVKQNCAACHGEGKGDITYSAPNWIFNKIEKTEKQVRGYLRTMDGDKDLAKTKIFAQVRSKHWSKTEPQGTEKEYGENNLENFKNTFTEYFDKVSVLSKIKRASSASAQVASKLKNLDYSNLINEKDKTAVKLKILQLSIGYSHSCALFENHKIKCWGYNDYRQAGYGEEDGPQFARNVVENEQQMGPSLPFVNLLEEKVTQVQVGDYFTCVVTEAKRLICWGRNGRGSLGIESALEPIKNTDSNVILAAYRAKNTLPYVNLNNEKVEKLRIYNGIICATFESGRAACWGINLLFLDPSAKLEGGHVGYISPIVSPNGIETLRYIDLNGEKALDFQVHENRVCFLLPKQILCRGSFLRIGYRGVETNRNILVFYNDDEIIPIRFSIDLHGQDVKSFSSGQDYKSGAKSQNLNIIISVLDQNQKFYMYNIDVRTTVVKEVSTTLDGVKSIYGVGNSGLLFLNKNGTVQISTAYNFTNWYEWMRGILANVYSTQLYELGKTMQKDEVQSAMKKYSVYTAGGDTKNLTYLNMTNELVLGLSGKGESFCAQTEYDIYCMQHDPGYFSSSFGQTVESRNLIANTKRASPGFLGLRVIPSYIQ